jgi:hypothetical protein
MFSRPQSGYGWKVHLKYFQCSFYWQLQWKKEIDQLRNVWDTLYDNDRTLPTSLVNTLFDVAESPRNSFKNEGAAYYSAIVISAWKDPGSSNHSPRQFTHRHKLNSTIGILPHPLLGRCFISSYIYECHAISNNDIVLNFFHFLNANTSSLPLNSPKNWQRGPPSVNPVRKPGLYVLASYLNVFLCHIVGVKGPLSVSQIL